MRRPSIASGPGEKLFLITEQGKYKMNTSHWDRPRAGDCWPCWGISWAGAAACQRVRPGWVRAAAGELQGEPWRGLWSYSRAQVCPHVLQPKGLLRDPRPCGRGNRKWSHLLLNLLAEEAYQSGWWPVPLVMSALGWVAGAGPCGSVPTGSQSRISPGEGLNLGSGTKLLSFCPP